MSVTPPISSFFGLDPRFLAGPAASSSLINPLLFGSSFQMVPINFGGFNSGIPPIFGGQGFTGFPTVPFNIFSPPSALFSVRQLLVQQPAFQPNGLQRRIWDGWFRAAKPVWYGYVYLKRGFSRGRSRKSSYTDLSKQWTSRPLLSPFDSACP